jgi:hypothetical protein
MTAFLLTILFSSNAMAVTQTVTCHGLDLYFVSVFKVNGSVVTPTSQNDLLGAWTRPQGGLLAKPAIFVGQNPWKLQPDLVTTIATGDSMANYQLQLPGHQIGKSFNSLQSEMIVEIETRDGNTARSGYDMLCTSAIN